MSATALRVSPARSPGSSVLVIEPAGRFPTLDLDELWAYRSLFFFLVWRDIKVRYAQTVLGAGWAILQPLLSSVLFTLIFGMFAKLPSDGMPYLAFSLAATVPWMYFSTAFTGAGNSLVQNAQLITKVYFPRLVVPAAAVLSALVDFGVSFVILLAVLFAYGIVPSPSAIALVPLLALTAALTAAGAGAWLAALGIRYRDVKYVVPFLVQVWMYASPVVYPMSLVPERWHWVYALNPMAGVIEGFRNVLLGTRAVAWSAIAISFLVALAMFVLGVLYFRRTEHVFADVA
jgi:lipopolysaccharide transport system permease protein